MTSVAAVRATFRLFYLHGGSVINRRKRKKVNHPAPQCPYCGAMTHLRTADGIYLDNSRNTMLYVCKNYPRCDSYVRVHPGTTIPVGTVANKKLRSMRNEAHRYFNQIYYRGIMSKQEAYMWLSDLLGLPMASTHIGMMGEYYCQLVIEECKKVLANNPGSYPRHPNISGGGMLEAYC